MSVFMCMNLRVAYSIEFGVEPGKYIEQVMLDCIAQYYEQYDAKYRSLREGTTRDPGFWAQAAQEQYFVDSARFHALFIIDHNLLLTNEEKEFLARWV